jgi:GST-like protein
MTDSAQAPIELYYWPTPNGWKISIMLEECGLPYTVHSVDIGKGDQFKPDFLKIAPNNKMPAIVDPNGPDGKPLSLFESGAILQYLGRKTAMFYPADERTRTEIDQWLFWQMGGLGPMAGQTHHFRIYAPEKIAYAIDRYTNETNRLYGVLNKLLSNASTWRASIRSPTWPRSVGPSCGSGKGRTSPSSRTWSAGSRRSTSDRPSSAGSPSTPATEGRTT